jgi:hypothetical protein
MGLPENVALAIPEDHMLFPIEMAKISTFSAQIHFRPQ